MINLFYGFNRLRQNLYFLLLLAVLLCSSHSAWAVSELTLRTTDLVSLISARVTAHSIDDDSREHFLQALANLETELKFHESEGHTNQFSSTNYPEMYLLLNRVREVLRGKNGLSANRRDMLLQQAELIIKKNKDIDFSGEDSLRSYHLFAKTIDVEQTYRLLSPNAQFKLPLTSFHYWWDKTVTSVAVKKVEYLGRNQYKAWLLYELQGGGKQCSEDWLQLIKGDDGWLIDDFYWSQTHVEYCENL